MKTILVAGGCGFVGSSIAISQKQNYPDARVIALDNLKRRGSEIQLPRLKQHNVEFLHGDIRVAADIEACGPFDLLIDCSAEPSVHAGVNGDPRYLLETNLVGTLNLLEAARRYSAGLIFFSTSRVYSIPSLKALPLIEGETRFELSHAVSNCSLSGISEGFGTSAPRSLYGTTKLASELFVQEYCAQHGLKSVIARCGVIAGPWQMGKVDQGFVALWCARHLWGGPLALIGYNGSGKQVRDVLHIHDLVQLNDIFVKKLHDLSGSLFNVGGGLAVSVSLLELTELCKPQGSGSVVWSQRPETPAVDIPWYVTDNTQVTAATGWMPQRKMVDIVQDTCAWLLDNADQLKPIMSA